MIGLLVLVLKVVGTVIGLGLVALFFPVRRVWPFPLAVAAMTPSPWLILLKADTRKGWQRDATLEHERIHQRQQLRTWFPYGWIRWMWRYFTDGEWRATYELEAYAVDVLAHEKHLPMAISGEGNRVYWVRTFARDVATSPTYTGGRLGPTMPLAWCEAKLTEFVNEREA